MAHYRITINSRDREAMLDLIRKHHVQVSDHGTSHSEATGYTVTAFAEPSEIQKLKSAGYHVEQHEDVEEVGKARQQEVGRGDRYKDKGPR
jgi:hypothetical protein